MTVHSSSNQKSSSDFVTMCWLSLRGNDNGIKLCFSRTYCGPQTPVWEPVDYIKDMKNSSNYISVQPLKTKNNNKYLLFALCCEWPPSVRVAYNKCNIKTEVLTFMSWNERPSPFTPREERPLGLKWLLIKSRSFRSRTAGTNLTQQALWASCCQLLKAIVARLWDRSGLKRFSSTSWPEKAEVTPAQSVDICFQCDRSDQYCPKCCRDLHRAPPKWFLQDVTEQMKVPDRRLTPGSHPWT